MITELGFPAPTDVRGRRSIADLLPKSRDRRGIYLLEFSDGTFYIGQALNVVRRFGQHRQRHDNMYRQLCRCSFEYRQSKGRSSGIG